MYPHPPLPSLHILADDEAALALLAASPRPYTQAYVVEGLMRTGRVGVVQLAAQRGVLPPDAPLGSEGTLLSHAGVKGFVWGLACEGL